MCHRELVLDRINISSLHITSQMCRSLFCLVSCNQDIWFHEAYCASTKEESKQADRTCLCFRQKNLLRQWEAAVAQCIFQWQHQASTDITVKLKREATQTDAQSLKANTAQQTKQYTAYIDGKQGNSHKTPF